MKLNFKKNEGKRHVVTYHRDNGTKTCMPADDFFIAHDLSHFAIEKTMGYKTAFYGMINGGIELFDFLDKQKREAMHFTDEAINAESMANLFLIDSNQGRIEGFHQLQNDVLRTGFPRAQSVMLTEEEIDTIRNYFSELLSQWYLLRPNEFLQLEIDV